MEMQELAGKINITVAAIGNVDLHDGLLHGPTQLM